jgi:hypothetical protein
MSDLNNNNKANNKKIHIEKYDFKKFEKTHKPYAMILNEVIQKMPISRSNEFLLWVFLESQSPSWEPNKKHITKYFNISDRTYERYMAWLNAVGLIEYRQDRNQDGSFGYWRLIVLDGTKFNPDAPSNRTAKIDGTVVNRLKKEKVIHISTGDRSAKFDGTVQSSTDQCQTALSQIPPFRQITVERCDDVHIKTTKVLNKEIKKTNNKGCSVFFDNYSVKNHIEKIICNRNIYVEDEIIEQGVYYSYTKNPIKTFDSINKKINIFLKKVREGAWLIPQGFNGITSQSIREDEEEHEKQKQIQQEEDARIFRELTNEAPKRLGEGFQGFSNMLKRLGGSTYAEQR